MTIEFVQLRETMTVERAMRYLRKTGLDKETIYTCYVLDERKVLLYNVSYFIICNRLYNMFLHIRIHIRKRFCRSIFCQQTK